MAVRNYWKLFAGQGEGATRDSTHMVQVEDLRSATGEILLEVVPSNLPPAYPVEDAATTIAMTETEARELITILQQAVGDVSVVSAAQSLTGAPGPLGGRWTATEDGWDIDNPDDGRADASLGYDEESGTWDLYARDNANDQYHGPPIRLTDEDILAVAHHVQARRAGVTHE